MMSMCNLLDSVNQNPEDWDMTILGIGFDNKDKDMVMVTEI